VNPLAKRSGELFTTGYYCAESVLLAIAEGRGDAMTLLQRLASGFCAGMGRTGGVCGAVAGGIMAIGLIHGRSDNQTAPDPVYQKVQQLIAAFEERFGSTNCRVLTGCDLLTTAGQQKFKDEKTIESCKVFTEAATEIAMALI